MEAQYYNVDVSWNGTRKGIMCSPEILEKKGACMEVATPPEFPNGIDGMWSPEHLFTAAVNSCLMTTFLAIAENSKLEFKDFSSSSKGKLEQVDGKYMMSEVLLYPRVIIYDEASRSKAERILQKAESACLISNSVKSKITMVTTITVEE